MTSPNFGGLRWSCNDTEVSEDGSRSGEEESGEHDLPFPPSFPRGYAVGRFWVTLMPEGDTPPPQRPCCSSDGAPSRAQREDTLGLHCPSSSSPSAPSRAQQGDTLPPHRPGSSPPHAPSGDQQGDTLPPHRPGSSPPQTPSRAQQGDSNAYQRIASLLVANIMDQAMEVMAGPSQPDRVRVVSFADEHGEPLVEEEEEEEEED